MDKTIACKALVDEFPHGTRALAEAMGMAYATLMHKANPRDTSQFFSPEECIRLQEVCGSYKPLYAEAEALGHVVLRRPAAVSQEQAAQLINGAVREFSEYLTEVTTALADGKVTANELARVDDECMSAIEGLNALRAHIAALHQLALPGALRQGGPA